MNWIQNAELKKGALHRQLGYADGRPIPVGLETKIQNANVGTHVYGHTVTPLLKRRVQFAINIRN